MKINLIGNTRIQILYTSIKQKTKTVYFFIKLENSFNIIMSYERFANESEYMTKLQQAIDRIEQKFVNSQTRVNGKLWSASELRYYAEKCHEINLLVQLYRYVDKSSIWLEAFSRLHSRSDAFIAQFLLQNSIASEWLEGYFVMRFCEFVFDELCSEGITYS